MGAACCTAAKDRTIVNGPHGEGLQRHAHYSPSWSFRWENRGRVAGEDTHANWLRDGGGGSDQGETKSSTTVETAFSSEEGSRLDSFQSIRCQKLPVSEGNAGTLRLPASGKLLWQFLSLLFLNL